MRWITKKRNFPKDGEVRIRRKFLFFPKTILEETRWLEFCTFTEMFVDLGGDYICEEWDMSYWEPICFI